MAGTGPAKDPNSRRSGAVRWTSLPAEGFDGTIPAWPFPTISDDESAKWERIWRTPQAAAWARLGWVDEVALYVRVLQDAAAGDMKAITEARLRSLELGLTPTGMLKNHWRITDDEVAAKRASTKTRARPKVVSSDALAQP